MATDEMVEHLRKALRTAGFVDLDDDTVAFWPHGVCDCCGPVWVSTRQLCEAVIANLPDLRRQAERADTPAAGEVREEFGWMHHPFGPEDIDYEDTFAPELLDTYRERARKHGGTVYRRTVTTTAWVEVSGKDE